MNVRRERRYGERECTVRKKVREKEGTSGLKVRRERKYGEKDGTSRDNLRREKIVRRQRMSRNLVILCCS